MTLLFQAELRKLGSRPSARACLVVLAVLGAAGPFLLWSLGSSGVSVNGQDVSEVLDRYAARGVSWSMWLRYFAGQAVMLLLAAQSFAGELQAHTLREEALRPVGRAAILGAKLAALASFSFASQVVGLGVAAAAGLALLAPSGEIAWSDLGLAAAGLALAEIAFASTALALSVLTRSPTAGVVAGIGLLAIERAVRVGMVLLGWLVQGLPAQMQLPAWATAALEVSQFAPSSGWDVWIGLLGGGTTWHQWVALAGWAAAGFGLAAWRFVRMDVS